MQEPQLPAGPHSLAGPTAAPQESSMDRGHVVRVSPLGIGPKKSQGGVQVLSTKSDRPAVGRGGALDGLGPCFLLLS